MSDGAQPTGLVERSFQFLLIISTLLLSWLGMMIVHELGHVLFAWVSGGAVSKVVLHPLVFSRTDLSRDPHPLFVVWGGALVGTTLPLVALALCKFFKAAAFSMCSILRRLLPGSEWDLYWCGFFFTCRRSRRNDARRHTSMDVGIIRRMIAVLGFYFWNGLGPHFGLGSRNGKVNPEIAIAVSLCLLGTIVIELLFDSR